MQKVCTKCKVEKTLSEFYAHKKGKFGRRASCKVCYNKQVDSWKSENQGKVKSYTQAWRDENKGKYNSSHSSWCSLNRDKRNHREAMRRARKMQATPPWLNDGHKEEIQLTYSLAKECELLTGDQYHVDHIVPLQGENVCGLHVPWNLQVLPADVNLKKSNSV